MSIHHFKISLVEANAVFLHRKYAIVPFYGGGMVVHMLNINIQPEEFPESGENATER